MRRARRNPARGVFWGVTLIATGALILLSQRGVLPHEWLDTWWNWWPALLVIFGFARLVHPADPHDVGGGVTMILFGFWFFANEYGWYGLTWHNSWPLVLVAAGAGIMARATAANLMRPAETETKEESHG